MNWKLATCLWACRQKQRRVRRLLRRACQSGQERALIYQALAKRGRGDSPWQILLTASADRALASSTAKAEALRRQGGEVRPFQEHWRFRVLRWWLLHCGREEAVRWLEREESREQRRVMREMLDLRDALRIMTGR